MSKNFEEEYREYLNAQAPDLWGRIEAGIDAVSSSDERGTGNVVPIKSGKKKRKKKKQIRYQHYRAIASVAACLFALVMIIPVYMLTKSGEKDQAASEAAEEIVLTDATITNTTEEAVLEESAVEESAPEEVAQESAPAQEAQPGEDGQEMQFEAETEAEAPAQELPEDMQGDDDLAQLATGDTSKGGATDEDSFAQEASGEETDTLEETAGVSEEQLQVTIVSEEGRQEAGMVYAAAVVGSASSKTISIIVPDDSRIVLEIGAQYAVTLQQFVEEGYRVVVDAVKQ